MAKGQRSLNMGKVEKKTYNREPVPAGDYDLKLCTRDAEIRKAQPSAEKPNPFSYVNMFVEVLGSGEDGQKNRRVYHNLFLRTSPGKDGSVMYQRADQIKGLADALDDQPELALVTQNGEDIIDPKSVVKWLQSHDGEVIKGHVKIQKGTKDYPDPKNVVSEFFEAEGSEDEGEDEELDEELDSEEDEESEEEEEELPPRKVKKAASGKRR